MASKQPALKSVKLPKHEMDHVRWQIRQNDLVRDHLDFNYPTFKDPVSTTTQDGYLYVKAGLYWESYRSGEESISLETYSMFRRSPDGGWRLHYLFDTVDLKIGLAQLLGPLKGPDQSFFVYAQTPNHVMLDYAVYTKKQGFTKGTLQVGVTVSLDKTYITVGDQPSEHYLNFDDDLPPDNGLPPVIPLRRRIAR